MTEVRIILSTIDTPEHAQILARQLVTEKLAACVNIIPEVLSIYKWKGEMQQEAECLLILKTPADRLEALVTRLAELHPYDVPEVVAFSVDQGHEPYLEWISEVVKS